MTAEHEPTVARAKHTHQRAADHEAPAWDADPAAALSQVRDVAGNQGLSALLGMRRPSLQRQPRGDGPGVPALVASVQREDGQAVDAKEAGRRERAARREALAERRKALDARRGAREARLGAANQPGPANQPAAAAAAAPAAAAGPTAAEIMAAKLAKFQELQNKRQAELAATTGKAAATAAPATSPAPRSAPKAVNQPDHAMAARLLSDLGRSLDEVAEPVTHQKIYVRATDKQTHLLFMENNRLHNELVEFIRQYRAGELSGVQLQAQKDAWQAKLGTYQQKVLAYKPPERTYRPQGHQSAAEIHEEAARQAKREGRWADKMR